MKMVSLRINGEDRSFEDAPTIAAVLEILDVPAEAVAVEVNRTIVPRATIDRHRLEDGDEIEVDLTTGKVSLPSGSELQVEPLSRVQLEIYARGGLLR